MSVSISTLWNQPPLSFRPAEGVIELGCGSWHQEASLVDHAGTDRLHRRPPLPLRLSPRVAPGHRAPLSLSCAELPDCHAPARILTEEPESSCSSVRLGRQGSAYVEGTRPAGKHMRLGNMRWFGKHTKGSSVIT